MYECNCGRIVLERESDGSCGRCQDVTPDGYILACVECGDEYECPMCGEIVVFTAEELRQGEGACGGCSGTCLASTDGMELLPVTGSEVENV